MRRAFKVSTAEVFAAVDGERDYQEARWNPETTESKGIHSFSEWITYMEDYLAEAKHILSREAKQTAEPKAAHIMRKVVAMGVASMEQLGAPERAGYPGRSVILSTND